MPGLQKEVDAAEKVAQKAPDQEKLRRLKAEVDAVPLPTMKTAEGNAAVQGVKALLQKVSAYIDEKIQLL